MATRDPWEIRLGTRVLGAHRKRETAQRKADRRRHSVEVRRSPFTLRVINVKTRETWELRRGSWIRSDPAAPTRAAPRAKAGARP